MINVLRIDRTSLQSDKSSSPVFKLLLRYRVRDVIVGRDQAEPGIRFITE
jgi:hypothetical protein